MMKRKSASRFNYREIDRLHLLSGVFFILALTIVWRLFDLQLLSGTAKLAEAYAQRSYAEELRPERGEIYTIASIHQPQELQPLAINEKRYLIYANPSEVTEPSNAAEKLAELLELEIEEIETKLRKEGDPYEPIKHAVDKELAEQVEGLNLAGIYKQDEIVRDYPMKNNFGQITGFMGFVDDIRVGQYGIEGFLEKLLVGQTGYLESERDPSGRMIALGERQLIPATDGVDFVLTLDPNIQQKTCSIIKATTELYQATGGTIIVMEPDSGAIRAMCSTPDFDPNNYNEVEDIDVYINPAVTGTYEPGSIFKAVNMAAALDSGSVEAGTTFIDTGSVVIGDHTIRNADNKVYGKQTMGEVLENSINTGSVFAALQTGRKVFLDYVEAFGFGQATGVEFPAESSGDISALEKPGDIFLATGSFGQGITVTPIQMVKAFATIANQGKLVQPRVIDRILMPDGEEIIFSSPVEGEQIISTQTAAILGALLVNVTEKGQGKAAAVQGFYVAGKTGTAQIAGRRGYSEDTIHSFVGYTPISDPRFVILIKLDRPQWGRFSSNTVGPVFSELASYLLQYYQVQPER